MGAPNPEILRWARESAGLSYADAVRKLNMSAKSGVATLEAYERGEKQPSRSRLLMMAKQYHRSYLTFFLSRPPKKVERGEDFRMPSLANSLENLTRLSGISLFAKSWSRKR